MDTGSNQRSIQAQRSVHPDLVAPGVVAGQDLNGRPLDAEHAGARSLVPFAKTGSDLQRLWSAALRGLAGMSLHVPVSNDVFDQ